MTWEMFQQKIEQDLGVGNTRGRARLLEFRQAFKGKKEAIEELISVSYNDLGRVVYKMKINGKVKQITI